MVAPAGSHRDDKATLCPQGRQWHPAQGTGHLCWLWHAMPETHVGSAMQPLAPGGVIKSRQPHPSPSSTSWPSCQTGGHCKASRAQCPPWGTATWVRRRDRAEPRGRGAAGQAPWPSASSSAVLTEARSWDSAGLMLPNHETDGSRGPSAYSLRKSYTSPINSEDR